MAQTSWESGRYVDGEVEQNTSMSQLTAIRLEVLGWLLIPFLTLAVIEAWEFVLPLARSCGNWPAEVSQIRTLMKTANAREDDSPPRLAKSSEQTG